MMQWNLDSEKKSQISTDHPLLKIRCQCITVLNMVWKTRSLRLEQTVAQHFQAGIRDLQAVSQILVERAVGSGYVIQRNLHLLGSGGH